MDSSASSFYPGLFVDEGARKGFLNEKGYGARLHVM